MDPVLDCLSCGDKGGVKRPRAKSGLQVWYFYVLCTVAAAHVKEGQFYSGSSQM